MSHPHVSCSRLAHPNSRWRRPWPAPAALLAASLTAVCWAADTRPTVAVLEFRVAVDNAPADFGNATAQVIASALAATDRYALIPQNRVVETTRQAGLRPPFGVGHIELLADLLGADIVVHGSIRGLSFDPVAGTASVRLVAEVVDGKSGDLKQTAEATGARSATATVAENHGQVVAQALADAAGKLAEAIAGVRVQAAPPGGGASAAAVAASVMAPPSAALLPAVAPGAVEQPATSVPRLDLFPKAPVAADPSTSAAGGGPKPPTTTQSPATSAVNQSNQSQPGLWAGGTSEEMAVEPIVRAKVLAKLGPGSVLITLGKDALVTPKMVMDVYRITYPHGDAPPERQKIGRIRVTKINATDAEARILEGAAVMRTGDMAYYFGE